MCALIKELLKTTKAHQLAFISVITLLSACSEPQSTSDGAFGPR